MTAPVKVIPTTYARMHVCVAPCDVCGAFGCLDSHGLCDAVNPEQTAGCFREPLHESVMRCEATDPYSRVSLRCIRVEGHEPPHLDAFGDDFGVDDQEPSERETRRVGITPL